VADHHNKLYLGDGETSGVPADPGARTCVARIQWLIGRSLFGMVAKEGVLATSTACFVPKSNILVV
jgi:hypothetical protein